MKIVRYAKLPLGFDAKATQSELGAACGQWSPHLNTYHYTGEWAVLPLRSPGGKHDNPVPDLMGEGSYLDTIYMEQFPSVKKLLAAIKSPIMSVRFLNLKAGAVIKEHRDAELALEQGEARLHFPVITNPEVEFYCEGERIFLNEGECWYLNANLPHRVSNNSTSDRIHLVVDCKADEWLKNMVASTEEIAYGTQKVDENISIAIRELRKENTEESNKRADTLESIISKTMAE
jgi:quercetin dioxygenase-like cupin family protein